MKIKPNIKKLTTNFLIWALIIAILFFFAFISFFVFSSWNWAQGVIIGVYVLLMILLYIVMYKTTYYIIEKKSFTYKCLGKETIFDYSKIHYIEAKQGRNSKTIGIYLNPNDVKYLTADKDGVLYDTLMKKCDQLFDEKFLK